MRETCASGFIQDHSGFPAGFTHETTVVLLRKIDNSKLKDFFFKKDIVYKKLEIQKYLKQTTLTVANVTLAK